MHDLAVVGAGPVGSYLASLCAGRMDTIVLEEHGEAGGKACSGLVSPRFIEMIPKKVKGAVIEHEVKGARITFMGTTLEFRKNATAAYVVNRNLMDRMLAEHASDCGADVRFGEKVMRADQTAEKVRLWTPKHDFESRFAAGCDGAGSAVSRMIGANAPEVLNGLIIHQKKENFSDTVEMWFDKSLVKDGFFWKIPRGSATEYGCIGYRLSFPILEKFFSLEPSDASERSAAPVPIGIKKTYENRTILVGDAASQTKPWSGGGLAYGFLAAKEASEIIANAVRTDDVSKLSLYEAAWKRIMVKDINAGLMLREIYRDLDLGAITSFMDRAESLKKESNRIDFDFPFSSALGRL